MVTGTTEIHYGFLLLIYCDDEKGHVGTFNYQEQTGYFGGSRIGSQNHWLKSGDMLLKDPFKF